MVVKWEGAIQNIKNKPPKLVLGELNRTETILRDILNSDFNNIFINDQKMFEETRDYIKAIAPEKEKIVRHV